MTPRSQRLAALWLAACFAAQPVTQSPWLAGLIALGFHGDGHAHSLSMEADAGHFDLVLSHADDIEHHPVHAGATSHADHPVSCSSNDHVVHLAGDPASREMGRRQVGSDAAALTLTQPVALATCEPRISRACSLRRAANGAHRSVVLRL